ncbi:hypothetical protein Hanom_Chr09g00805221 [Helianthus anomalus]
MNLHYHFLAPGEDLDLGLRPLSNHHNALSLIRHLLTNSEYREIEIYIEAGGQ